MRFKQMWGLLGLLLTICLVMPTSFAQDDDGLSEDELAALDRVMAIYELRESYSAYTFVETENDVVASTITIGEEVTSSDETRSFTTLGYLIRNKDQESFAYDSTLNYTNIDGDTTIDYALAGQFIMVDGVLYVNASQIGEGENAPPILEGWQVIPTPSHIPESFENWGLSAYFDDTVPDFFENKDVLVEYASSVTVSQKEIQTEDGNIGVDEIVITVEDDVFRSYFQALLDSDPDRPTPPIIKTIFSEEGVHGQQIIVAQFTEAGNIYQFHYTIEFGIEGMNADSLLGSDSSDATMDWFISVDLIQIYTDINSEFEEIVAPE